MDACRSFPKPDVRPVGMFRVLPCVVCLKRSSVCLCEFVVSGSRRKPIGTTYSHETTRTTQNTNETSLAP